MIYDYSQNSYKRGWKVNEGGEFSSMVRLVLLKAFLEFCKEKESIWEFQMVVNKIYLKEEMERKRIESLPLK